mgnify:FL=1
MAMRTPRCVLMAAVFLAATSAIAEDVYYRIPVSQLKFTDSAAPPSVPHADWRSWQLATAMKPYATLDGPGEIIVTATRRNDLWGPPDLTQAAVVLRTPQKGDLTGQLVFPNSDYSGMVVRPFAIPASTASVEAEKEFQTAKRDHYNSLWARDVPGAAWFRHQARVASGQTTDSQAAPVARFNQGGRLEETYALFSGGRAVSENLQLDRVLRETKDQPGYVDIASIQGITVQEIDWRPLVKDLKPTLDPLAKLIPADQHVVFFPSFNAAVHTFDEAERQGTPILHLAEPRSEDARTAERYQRQLGLSLSGLGRLLGPHVAASVALTGSDPYYRVGTDVAVLFETANPALLEGVLLTQITLSAAETPTARPVQGKIEEIDYRGMCSPDRAVCSYLARLEGAVVVTNSLDQLRRLAAVAKRGSPSIASLDEYIFFRDRYRRDDSEETALVFLSDATIRRWCGPRWRIATSRRMRDMAVLSELQAANMARFAKRTAEPGPIYTDLPTANVGQLMLGSSGVRSSAQGSLAFMTPIVEQELTRITKAEADAYVRWRDDYQRNWHWAFDPIAIRLMLQKDRTGADLSVMPLILGSRYHAVFNMSEGAHFGPTAGDPHDALIHLILAINTSSNTIRQSENFISTMSKGVTLGWLGQSIAVYLDDAPVWAELAKIPEEKRDAALGKLIGRLPVAVRAEVKDGLRLTAFLASLRAFIEQTAPGMTEWQSLAYKDQPYVRISPSQRAKGQHKDLETINIYYVASGDALLVSLNEDLVKRAIDRQLPRNGGLDGENLKASTPEWLGRTLGLRVERKAVDLLCDLSRQSYQEAMQLRAWSNLPILNEWKRLYPDQDPVELHERVWKIRLVCPGGGRYVWNEKYRTMESTVYGHPGDPKTGMPMPVALDQFSSGSFGVTLEKQGLRARVLLQHAGPADKSQARP